MITVSYFDPVVNFESTEETNNENNINNMFNSDKLYKCQSILLGSGGLVVFLYEFASFEGEPSILCNLLRCESRETE